MTGNAVTSVDKVISLEYCCMDDCSIGIISNQSIVDALMDYRSGGDLIEVHLPLKDKPHRREGTCCWCRNVLKTRRLWRHGRRAITSHCVGASSSGPSGAAAWSAGARTARTTGWPTGAWAARAGAATG